MGNHPVISSKLYVFPNKSNELTSALDEQTSANKKLKCMLTENQNSNSPDCIVKIMKALVRIHVASSHVISSSGLLVVTAYIVGP